MARATRQARDSTFPLRSCTVEHEKHLGVREESLQVKNHTPQRFDQESPAVRAVRVVGQICDAAVLHGPSQPPRNSHFAKQQHRGHQRGWTQAILEFERTHARCFGPGNIALSRDIGQDLRMSQLSRI
jgi:hypothetical protein